MIAIPYFSGSGHTRRLAQAIASGAGDAHLIDVTHMAASDWDVLDAATAIIFGAPTYMGSTASQFDGFLENAAASRWDQLVWRDKIAAGFTVATHPSGDKLVALQRMNIYAAQMAMVWVGQTEIGSPVNPDNPGINRDGCWLGLMATASRDKAQLIDPLDLETARRFGERLRAASDRWARGA